MFTEVVATSSRSRIESHQASRLGLFRRLFGTGQRRRRTYVPLTPDVY